MIKNTLIRNNDAKQMRRIREILRQGEELDTNPVWFTSFQCRYSFFQELSLWAIAFALCLVAGCAIT